VRAIKRASKEEADKLVGPWIDVIQYDVKQDCAESSQEPRSSAFRVLLFEISRRDAPSAQFSDAEIRIPPPPSEG